MEQVQQQTREQMDKTLEMVRREMASVRTGRAAPSLIEGVEIQAYDGAPAMRLLELATISAPDAQTLVVTPFDPSVIEKIEKGLRESHLGLNPAVDEKIIRIAIPPLTEERRREFVKLIGEKAEAGKVMVRQARHDGMERVKAGGDSISEDDVKRAEDGIQKLTDEYNSKIEEMREAKEKELMQL